MKNFIGGSFKQEQEAIQARRALREAGFPNDYISMLTRKPQNTPVHQDRVQAGALLPAALKGAALLGLLGGLFGLLAGLGIIPIPGVDAATYSISTGFVLSSALAGLIAGAVTGAILGTAFRLLRSQDKAAITAEGIKRGGLLVVTRVDQMNTEESARQILQQHGAVDLQNLSEKWDASVWSELEEVQGTGPH